MKITNALPFSEIYNLQVWLNPVGVEYLKFSQKSYEGHKNDPNFDGYVFFEDLALLAAEVMSEEGMANE